VYLTSSGPEFKPQYCPKKKECVLFEIGVNADVIRENVVILE
jgi:hypothetical protein